MDKFKFLEIELVSNEQQIGKTIADYQREYLGKVVRLKTSKYKGREAVIDGVVYNGGKFGFGCMVLRSDGSRIPLNSDGDSRAYRPRSHFEFV
jgi:hypothetical protein